MFTLGTNTTSIRRILTHYFTGSDIEHPTPPQTKQKNKKTQHPPPPPPPPTHTHTHTHKETWATISTKIICSIEKYFESTSERISLHNLINNAYGWITSLFESANNVMIFITSSSFHWRTDENDMVYFFRCSLFDTGCYHQQPNYIFYGSFVYSSIPLLLFI